MNWLTASSERKPFPRATLVSNPPCIENATGLCSRWPLSAREFGPKIFQKDGWEFLHAFSGKKIRMDVLKSLKSKRDGLKVDSHWLQINICAWHSESRKTLSKLDCRNDYLAKRKKYPTITKAFRWKKRCSGKCILRNNYVKFNAYFCLLGLLGVHVLWFEKIIPMFVSSKETNIRQMHVN